MHAPFSDPFVPLAALGDMLDALGDSGGPLAYGWMCAALLLGTLGVPVPEEAVFATAGALAATGRMAWFLAWLVGWCSIVLLDLALHACGRALGPGVEGSRLGRRLKPARWAALRAFVDARGAWAVAGARFVMGTRIPVFLLAGALGMPRRRFLLVIAPLAAVSVGLPMALGALLGTNLEGLLDALGTARWGLLALAAAGVLAWWGVARSRRRY